MRGAIQVTFAANTFFYCHTPQLRSTNFRLCPLPYDQVSRFATNLATCLAAGVDMRKAIRTGSQTMSKSSAEAWQLVLRRLDEGEPLAQALRAIDRRLPPFFIPVVDAGEQAGRLEDSLRFLAEDCRMLARPTAALRNVWLAPVAIIVIGNALGVVLQLLFGSWSGFLNSARDTIVVLGSLAAIAVLIIATPLRVLVDHVKVVLPILGPAEREMAVNRFFRVFSMLYATGGMRVEQMIRHASRAVTNHYLRNELRRAAAGIVRGETISAAFAKSVVLTVDEKDTLAAGDLAGKLTESCERIANNATELLEARMKMLTPIIVRITFFLVSLSLAGALLPLLTMLAYRFMLPH